MLSAFVNQERENSELITNKNWHIMKKQNEKKESDSGLFGLGGLFKGIEKLIDLAGQVTETGGGEVHKEGTIDLEHLKQGMKGVYGFTIKSAVGGVPTVETFGNIKKTPEGPKVEEEREPITDVFDEENEMIIIAEMPGMKEEEISIELKDDILEISATSKIRKYRKEVLLPAKGIQENLSSTYNNGILEIRIKK
jgi:HSP20 family protein